MVMIRQRKHGRAPAVQAFADALPFRDCSFDASLAILTVHHWTNRQKGLAELLRVARDRVIIVTWDPASEGFWLPDYFPEILDIDRQIFPALAEFRRRFAGMSIQKLLVPHDCCDGFLGAYWQRPSEYLRADVRSAISTFSKIKDPQDGLRLLSRDLESGRWHRRYGENLESSDLDLGYRIVIGCKTA